LDRGWLSLRYPPIIESRKIITGMNWLEVSLFVDGEMAEAVAEVLARFAPNGVIIESTAIEPDLEGEGRPVGPLRVCAYLPADETVQAARREIEESLWHLGCIQPLPPPKFNPIQELNWADTWKKNYHPIPVGKRLIIVPAWLETPDKTRIPIRIDPGMAFGTGTHPSTQLCLALLDDLTPPVGDIFDIGCGSGILSVAALKLGARRAFGVDIEADAVACAYENAKANGVEDQVEFSLGSLDVIKSGIFDIRQAPLVVANILAHILHCLLDEGLGELIAPGGTLILSGILEEQVPDMLAKIEKIGFHVATHRQIDDWVAFAVQR
jgi:ribosomal protein L11 methyltransferase